VRYEGVVVTNITHEHLDYHGTLEEYAQVKISLIKDAYVAVLNGDDEVTQNVYRSLPTYLHRNVKLFGLHNKADYMYDFGALFPKLEQFNKYNYLAAYALCCELGLSGAELLQHFATYKLPSGRIDVVYDGDFKVIVDFAHTPNAIARILKSVREVHMQPGGRLIHVFGSAGLRDASKRPSMGKASAEFADYAYITEEDYRTENPLTIAHQIASGFQGYATSFQIEVNRETAIQKALAMAKKGDLVILTGKGHEKSLCRGKVEYPWSDVECVKRLLNLN
jgi:UDP-N-acetylmuramoyl-L-alanyl-D-glutamate--2,6-diaminopimelate ligase